MKTKRLRYSFISFGPGPSNETGTFFKQDGYSGGRLKAGRQGAREPQASRGGASAAQAEADRARVGQGCRRRGRPTTTTSLLAAGRGARAVCSVSAPALSPRLRRACARPAGAACAAASAPCASEQPASSPAVFSEPQLAALGRHSAAAALCSAALAFSGAALCRDDVEPSGPTTSPAPATLAALAPPAPPATLRTGTRLAALHAGHACREQGRRQPRRSSQSHSSPHLKLAALGRHSRRRAYREFPRGSTSSGNWRFSCGWSWAAIQRRMPSFSSMFFV